MAAQERRNVEILDLLLRTAAQLLAVARLPGGCGLQQVGVPGSQGRTTVNIWRC